MKFGLKDIKKMSLSDLYYYAGKAMLSQGNGCNYSQMLENRIERINKEIEKRTSLPL